MLAITEPFGGETMMKSLLRRKQAQTITALVMVIAVLATLGGLGFSTRIAGAASPHNASATKVPLTTQNRDCSGTAIKGSFGNGHGTGSAIIGRMGAGKLTANVVLQNATHNATYDIRLIQTPNAGRVRGSDCIVVDGKFSTNAQGNGSANIQESVLSGTKGAFVALNNQAALAKDYYTTQDVTV